MIFTTVHSAALPTIDGNQQFLTNYGNGTNTWKTCFSARGVPLPTVSLYNQQQLILQKTIVQHNPSCFDVPCCQHITAKAMNCFGMFTQYIYASGETVIPTTEKIREGSTTTTTQGKVPRHKEVNTLSVPRTGIVHIVDTVFSH